MNREIAAPRPFDLVWSMGALVLAVLLEGSFVVGLRLPGHRAFPVALFALTLGSRFSLPLAILAGVAVPVSVHLFGGGGRLGAATLAAIYVVPVLAVAVWSRRSELASSWVKALLVGAGIGAVRFGLTLPGAGLLAAPPSRLG